MFETPAEFEKRFDLESLIEKEAENCLRYCTQSLSQIIYHADRSSEKSTINAWIEDFKINFDTFLNLKQFFKNSGCNRVKSHPEKTRL